MAGRGGAGTEKLITVSGGENGGMANGTTNKIASVIQTVLATQLVSRSGILPSANNSVQANGNK